ncbi:hypothetical protein GCM10022377_10280 [Zhihengliuella alba]|uniref:Uncharacterized protein n=1 Tax=Zhihengliuella alba TaxID=547018 RepID=A0ABP7D4D5_9MICC
MSTPSPRGYPMPIGGDPIRGNTTDNLRVDIVDLAMAIDTDMTASISMLEDDIAFVEKTAATALITAIAPFEGVVGDKDGRPSWIQYDGYGMPTAGAVDGLYTAGVPHTTTETDDDGLRLAGNGGEPTWLSAGPDGRPDLVATTAIANAVHYYAGPTPPYVYPGNFILWVRTTGDGTPIDTQIGRN